MTFGRGGQQGRLIRQFLLLQGGSSLPTDFDKGANLVQLAKAVFSIDTHQLNIQMKKGVGVVVQLLLFYPLAISVPFSEGLNQKSLQTTIKFLSPAEKYR